MVRADVALGLLSCAVGALLIAPTIAGAAQPATAPATRPADAPVTMDFPAEGIELRTLADIVTKRLGIPILYDESIVGKRVIIRVPRDVPESALLGVLNSALRMKQMALVDAEQPGFKQIVAVQNLAAVARPIANAEGADPGEVVAQVIALKNADAARIVEAIRPLLTQPGGNAQPVQGQKAVIVSDYASVVRRAEALAKTLDTSGPAFDVQFVPLKHADASTVVSVVTQILTTREAAQWGAAQALPVQLSADERVNQIIVLSPPDRTKEVVDLIKGLDKPLDLQTKVYRLRSVSPDKVDKLMKGLLGQGAKRGYQSSVDADSQTLVAAATPEVHAQIASVIRELDVPISEVQSPVRFYKLKNTKAADVLATLQSLYGEASEGSRDETGETSDGSSNLDTPRAATIRNVRPRRPLGDMETSPGPSSAVTEPLRTVTGLPPADERGMQPVARTAEAAAAAGDEQVTGVRAPGATVTADIHTNSIIVIAPPAVQQLYADLITRLDTRRPQVQVECTIVTLDTSDNFSLGVDIASQGGFGDNRILTFSSFGVSTLDPTDASLRPGQGRGGTFAVLSPGGVDIVLRALATHSRSRLVSAPQILVNDNGRGKLQSVAQEPYVEILDTNTTQSRTGLGGQAQAGTTISVEPHISEDDYLQLAYSIELSSFTGTARSGLPPPSLKNTIDSTVTIPDGYTIVVGGLSVKDVRDTRDSIPGIDRIPVLRDLFGTQTRSTRDSTLFVFIRPTILRDDKFGDLKFLSDHKAHQSGLPPQFPSSGPIPLQ